MNVKPNLVSTTRQTARMDVARGLTRKLRTMETQFQTLSMVGGGIGSSEIEQISRDLGQLVRQARELEEEKVQAENKAVRDTLQHLFDAEGAFNYAHALLRERLHEAEADPAGTISAAIQTGQAMTDAALRTLAGRQPS